MKDKILMVDDSKFARVLLRRALEGGNLTNVVEATNAAEALQLYEQEKPDLVFLDISLPDSMDLQLLDKLLALDPAAKIIMCSALGQDLVIEEALKKGAADFVVKPFDEKQLLAATVQILAQENDRGIE